MKKIVAILLVIFVMCGFFSGCDYCFPEIESKYSSDNLLAGFFRKSQKVNCEQIAQNLSVNDLDTAVNLSESLELPLSEEEKNIVMKALENVMNSKMESFLKSFASNSHLISNETMEEIMQYKLIITNVGITDSDYTNIDDYINSVLDLNSYKKYDDIWSYWEVSLDDWNDGNKYWAQAFDCYSDYMRNMCLEKALVSFENCVMWTNDYSTNSFGISEVRDFAQSYVDRIEYYFNTGNDLDISDYIIDAYSVSQEEFVDKTNELINDLKELPLSVYYGNE